MSRNLIRDEDNDILEIDVSGAMSTLSRLHIETHKGNAYEVGNIFATPVADGSSVDLMVTVPATQVLHMAITAQVEVRSQVSVIDGVAATHGTPITPRNLNRVFPDASEAIWSHTPTGISGGTTLVPQLIPAGAKDKGGGLSGVFVEHDIAPTDIATPRDYIIRVTNISGGVSGYNAIYILYYGVPYSG